MKDMVKKHIEALRSLEGTKIESGWFESNVYPDGTHVAEVARINEFGTVIARPSKKGPVMQIIPARPFMRFAWSNFLQSSRSLQKQLAKQIFSGAIRPEDAVGKLASLLEGEIVNSIYNGPWTPNAASTERAKGFNKPLIKDSIMAQSVNSRITKE